MKRKWVGTTVLLLIAFSCPIVWGDVIDLDDGSRIVGRIEKIIERKVYIKTDFSETLEIDMAHVVNLSSDSPLFVAFTSGKKVYGTIQQNQEQTMIHTPEGGLLIEEDVPAAAWMKGQPDPLAPEKRKWRYEVGLDLAGKTGNSERIGIGGKINSFRQGPHDLLLIYLKGSYAKDDGNTTDQRIVGGADYEESLGQRLSWYARSEVENDKIKDITLRPSAALGYGYYFIKKSYQSLRGRAGISYRYQSISGGESESSFGPDFEIYHMFQFDDRWRLTTDITYMPSVTNFSDYLFYHESAFEIPLGGTDKWKMQVGVTNEYDAEPAPGKENLDTTYFSRVVFEFEQLPKPLLVRAGKLLPVDTGVSP